MIFSLTQLGEFDSELKIPAWMKQAKLSQGSFVTLSSTELTEVRRWHKKTFGL